ncbi:MAG: hypothetical protein J5I81_09710 [Nitrococcus mobilis]|nr:hypothetical protein [Nitrococcus mobilis]
MNGNNVAGVGRLDPRGAEENSTSWATLYRQFFTEPTRDEQSPFKMLSFYDESKVFYVSDSSEPLEG